MALFHNQNFPPMNIFEKRADVARIEKEILSRSFPDGLPLGVTIERVLFDTMFGGIKVEWSKSTVGVKYFDTMDVACEYVIRQLLKTKK